MLEGISTQGKDNGFVSKFTVLYSESSDGPLQPFVDVSKPAQCIIINYDYIDLYLSENSSHNSYLLIVF